MINHIQETHLKRNFEKEPSGKPLFTQIILAHVLKISPAFRHILEKMTVLLIPLPLFMLITGIEGIIANESPDNLASISTVGSGFFNFLDMHSLIILGAFGVTFIIWFLTRNIWDDEEEIESEELSIEYDAADYEESSVDQQN